MSTDTTAQSEVIIACNPNALTAEQQARWMEVGPQLYAAVQEVQELPDGYAFRLPSDFAHHDDDNNEVVPYEPNACTIVTESRW